MENMWIVCDPFLMSSWLVGKDRRLRNISDHFWRSDDSWVVADVCRMTSRPPSQTLFSILPSWMRSSKTLGAFWSPSDCHLWWRHLHFLCFLLHIAQLSAHKKRKWCHPRWRSEAEVPPFSATTTIGLHKCTIYYCICVYVYCHLMT